LPPPPPPHRAHTPTLARLQVAAQELLYNTLFDGFVAGVGKCAAKKEVEEAGHWESGYTYGEIKFESFGLIMEKIKKTHKGLADKEAQHLFVDLGAGMGKPCFAAALLGRFARCVGIEALEGLHVLCNEMHAPWEKKIKSGFYKDDKRLETAVEFVRGDFCDLEHSMDWTQADVVFCHGPLYGEDVMEKIANLATGMRAGCFFVAFTRQLENDRFEVLEKGEFEMDWGTANVFIQRRKPDEPTEEGEGGEAARADI
jgi:SAM-dependent methyltransferase